MTERTAWAIAFLDCLGPSLLASRKRAHCSPSSWLYSYNRFGLRNNKAD
nr:hypothetical protein [uncultured Cohaesibacter sp.]